MLKETDEADQAANTPDAVYIATRSPVLELPDELLVLIFSLIESTWTPVGKDDLGWLNVTFVCRPWRASALQAPSLWTRVDLHLGSEWAAAFFERAGPMALALSTEAFAQDEAEKAIRVLGTLVARETWPWLHTLCLPLILGFRFSLLPTAALSNLRSLTLSDRVIRTEKPWHLIPYTLEDLDLIFVFAPSPFPGMPLRPFHLDGLVYLLTHLKALRSLTLHFCSFQDSELSSATPVGLPALRQLNLSGAGEDCLRFLRSLEHPDKISKLALTLGDYEEFLLDEAISYVLQSSKALPREPYTSMGVTRTYDEMTIAACRASAPTGMIDALFAQDDTYAHQSRAIKDVDLCYSVVDDYAGVDGSMYSVFHGLDLTCVRALYFDNVHLAPASFLRTFGPARAIEELHLTGQGMCGALAALGLCTCSTESAITTSLTPVQTATDMIFPHLCVLRIQSIDFDVLDEGGVDPSLTVAQVLRRTLAARAQLRGVPRTMSLKDCYVNPDWEQQEIHSWNDVVPPVLRDWDARTWRFTGP
ncbi:hypothetical protein PENSPDRAFT_757109 [Peniophora sp. CONT]|nr:hypothetical protein PENSPDRAFT_757109 [Peniophora sp. CONT]